MSTRTIILLLVAALLALFTIINWQAFMTPTTLWLLFASVQAPLGLVMLGMCGLLTALFLLYVAYMQTTAILEARRYARELQAQRQVADGAEASRIAELRSVVEAGVRSLEQRITQSQSAAQSALGQLALELRATIEQSGTVLTSYIGEMEDRLEHQLASAKPAHTP